MRPFSSPPNRRRRHRARRSRSGSSCRPGNEYRLRLDSDQRADPGRQPTRAGPERRRRAARDLEPRQLADVDLRDSALPGREGGRNLDGRDRVAGEQRPQPRCHARQDVEALRAGSRRHQHVHRSGGGGHWTLQSGASWGGAVAESAYVIGATVAKDGQPVTAWRGSAAAGVPPGSIPQAYEPGMIESFLATDAGSGAIVLSGATNAGQGGVYVQRVLPSPGPRVVLPPLGKEWGNGLSGRIGAAGVYVAYADGKAARLYRYGGRSRTLARGAYSSATLCAGPGGRLWIAWGDNARQRLRHALEPGGERTRTRAAAEASGRRAHVLECEGSMGPADLFASAQLGGGFWHAHVPAQLSLSAQATRTKVTISARERAIRLRAPR